MNRDLKSSRKYGTAKQISTSPRAVEIFKPGSAGLSGLGNVNYQYLVDGFCFWFFALSRHSPECLPFNFRSINVV
jgi:hypothetical protein